MDCGNYEEFVTLSERGRLACIDSLISTALNDLETVAEPVEALPHTTNVDAVVYIDEAHETVVEIHIPCVARIIGPKRGRPEDAGFPEFTMTTC